MAESDGWDPADPADTLAGPIRRPVNVARGAVGSIHDDGTAQALGFRGGTIAANIHFEQFPPLLIARFGPDWWRTGGLSLHFMHATVDDEPVQALVGPVQRAGAIKRADCHMEAVAGGRVCEGSAWVGGDDAASALKVRLAHQREPTELRILSGCRVGAAVSGVPSRLESGPALERLRGITEPLDEYRQGVAAPAVAIDALRAVETQLFESVGDFVGMFGAIELQFLHGPIRLDHDYLADGRIMALGDSPKTEITWYESVLRDAHTGAAVARMLMMSRVLKASSPLWS